MEKFDPKENVSSKFRELIFVVWDLPNIDLRNISAKNYVLANLIVFFFFACRSEISIT